MLHIAHFWPGVRSAALLGLPAPKRGVPWDLPLRSSTLSQHRCHRTSLGPQLLDTELFSFKDGLFLDAILSLTQDEKQAPALRFRGDSVTSDSMGGCV